jgi:hypothetical protein
VLFEAAGLIKEALIRDWGLLQESDIFSLRQYLLQYVLNHLGLAPFVRERVLQVIAVMVKRGSVEDFGIERGSIVAEIENLIISGDTVKVFVFSIIFTIFLKIFILETLGMQYHYCTYAGVCHDSEIK